MKSHYEHPSDCICNGEGWVWGYELPDPEHDTADDTATRYPCPYQPDLDELVVDIHSELAIVDMDQVFASAESLGAPIA